MSLNNSPSNSNSPTSSTTQANSDLAYQQRSSQEMSASAAASAAALALALDLKPKHNINDANNQPLMLQQPSQQQHHHHQQQQQQKIKKCALTSNKRITSFSKILNKRPLTRSFNKKLLPTTLKNPSTTTTNPSLSNRFIKTHLTNTLNTSTSHSNILTKETFLFTLDLLAVVRRNASDKLKLIQMVHDNPILWDSRLPNFKGAEEEKNRAWEQIGKEFNAPGRRVARAFKSLRESYRRELAHVKLMGNNFKPKWSLYDAMDFLRDVIRERKGGSHAAENSVPLGLNLSALAHHMTATVNNNMINNNNNNDVLSNNSSKNQYKLHSLHSSFNDSALNLSKCSSSLNNSTDDYYYFVKPELDLSNQNTNPNANNALPNGGTNNAALNIPPAHQNLQHNDSRVTSTRNDSSNQNNTYDDLDNSSVRSGEDESSSARNTALSHQGSDEVEELEAIDADFPYPLILNSNSPSTSNNGPANKRRRKHLQSSGADEEEDEGDDEDEYEGQMLQQHRHLRAQQNQTNNLAAAGAMNGLGDMMPAPQTVREVLNSKFCGFISAKLNSMEDSEADNLMNKILMLLVQTQMSQNVNNSALTITNGQNDLK